MPKCIKKDGKVYRKRRGKWIQVPEEWVGHTSGRSRMHRKQKRADPWSGRRIRSKEKTANKDFRDELIFTGRR